MRFRGKGRNTDRKIALIRKASMEARTAYSAGGKLKRFSNAPKPVTLPTLQTVRKLMHGSDESCTSDADSTDVDPARESS